MPRLSLSVSSGNTKHELYDFLVASRIESIQLLYDL